jgi:threonine-phosphate decarboxylase
MTAGPEKKVIHGGSGKRQHEKTLKNVLDFSASVNPFPPEVTWECDAFFLEHYPDDTYSRLKEVIADTFHRKPEEICVGNGSIELIRICCMIILSGKGSYYTETPTFGEYAYSAELFGGRRAKRMADADLLFICNPNNPDGILRSRDEMHSFLGGVEERGAVLAADEAFIDLSDPNQSLSHDKSDSLLVLRSLTKCFAVPGIRFGYGFGPPDLIERIEAARLPWTVNSYAETFALQAFSHFQKLAYSRRLIARERAFLTGELRLRGLSCAPSAANYLLVETGKKVTVLCRMLEKEGILVRNCTSFGLPTKIRVAIRTHDENRQLLEALSACLP